MTRSPVAATPPEAAGSWLVAALLAVFFAAFLLPPAHARPVALVPPVLLALALVARAPDAAHLALAWCTVGAALALGAPGPTCVAVLLGLAAYGMILRLTPFPERRPWLRRGTFGRAAAIWIVATAFVSAIALAVWATVRREDLARVSGHVPDLAWPSLVLLGLAFSVANAAAEEALFRGLLQDTLEADARWSAWAVPLPALAFGAFHWHGGFPNGPWGAGMTTAYGVMLGLVRRHTGGLLAPFVAHVAADLVVFAWMAAFRNP